ncbi:hypothetical protein [Sorangium sp. So ce124]|uniref:hypothetical protein n=1 Tax=Sorangium sp. So ce124 TaxID=3133280 RepID=UPI003F62104C
MGSSALAVLSAARRSSAPWAAAALLGLGAVTVITAPSCGNDAVGVDACRRIERARCEAAAVCPEWIGSGDAEERVNTCVEFYWDQCLHGIEGGAGGGQAAAEPTTAQVDACVAAVGEARACASAKVASMAECSAASLAGGIDPAISPCVVITARAEALEACAFVAPNGGGAGIGSGGSGSAGSGGSGSAGSGGSGSAGSGGSGGDSAGNDGSDGAGNGGSGGGSAGSGGFGGGSAGNGGSGGGSAGSGGSGGP